MLTFISKYLSCVMQRASSLQSAWKAGSPLAVLFTALAAWELFLCTHSSKPRSHILSAGAGDKEEGM